MRKFFVILVIASIVLSSCSAIGAFLAGESGNVESVKSNDAEMNAAIQQAKDSFPLFIEAFQSPKPTQSYFGVKVRFPFGNNENGEHIWVSQLTFNDNQFTGVVGNEPLYVKDIKLGDTVIINNDAVSDWMIIDDGKLLGGFTIYVLRNSMTENERKQFESEIGFIMGDEHLLP
jgi:uncharacterized protein YegJ (DUF2314 family)